MASVNNKRTSVKAPIKSDARLRAERVRERANQAAAKAKLLQEWRSKSVPEHIIESVDIRNVIQIVALYASPATIAALRLTCKTFKGSIDNVAFWDKLAARYSNLPMPATIRQKITASPWVFGPAFITYRKLQSMCIIMLTKYLGIESVESYQVDHIHQHFQKSTILCAAEISTDKSGTKELNVSLPPTTAKNKKIISSRYLLGDRCAKCDNNPFYHSFVWITKALRKREKIPKTRLCWMDFAEFCNNDSAFPKKWDKIMEVFFSPKITLRDRAMYWKMWRNGDADAVLRCPNSICHCTDKPRGILTSKRIYVLMTMASIEASDEFIRQTVMNFFIPAEIFQKFKKDSWYYKETLKWSETILHEVNILLQKFHSQAQPHVIVDLIRDRYPKLLEFINQDWYLEAYYDCKLVQETTKKMEHQMKREEITKRIYCWNCRKVSANLLMCKRCGQARYCDAQCQKSHWVSTHRAECCTE